MTHSMQEPQQVVSAATPTKQYAKSVVIDSDKLRRNKWGVDNEHEDEYWFNQQVSLFFFPNSDEFQDWRRSDRLL